MRDWFSTLGGLETREMCVLREADRIGRSILPDFAFDPRGSDYAKYSAASAERVKHRRRWPGWPLPNVWLGVTVEDQRRANERIPSLLDTPAAIRFLSCEPLLEPVQIPEYLRNKLWSNLPSWKSPELDWVIVGGESGRGAREFDLGWARDLVAQCKNAGVAVFVKQLGANPIDPWADTGALVNDREPATPQFKHSHGGDMEEWPSDLQVREFPAIVEAAV